MFFGLGGLLLGCLLIANGVAVLNNERLLEPSNWGVSQLSNRGFNAAPNALKYQIIGFYNAVTYLRVPLLFINAVVVVVMLIF